MTVTVITPAKERDVTCKTCGAVLSYTISDIKGEYGEGYGHYIDCPVEKCGGRPQVLRGLDERQR